VRAFTRSRSLRGLFADQLRRGDHRSIFDHLLDVTAAGPAVATGSARTGHVVHRLGAVFDDLTNPNIRDGPTDANEHEQKIMKTIIKCNPKLVDSA